MFHTHSVDQQPCGNGVESPHEDYCNVCGDWDSSFWVTSFFTVNGRTFKTDERCVGKHHCHANSTGERRIHAKRFERKRTDAWSRVAHQDPDIQYQDYRSLQG